VTGIGRRMDDASRLEDRLAYLTCPRCHITLFDRNPLATPHPCPRCSRRGLEIELQRLSQVEGRAAASVLGIQNRRRS
jgi:hypothetical protein